MSPFALRLLTLFILLLFVHSLADYPLQSDFLAKAKRRNGVKGIPWQWALFFHSYIHAAGVVLVTGSMLAGAVELVAHAAIDYCKCAGRFGFSVDQTLHIVTKVAIVGLLAKGII